jgi:phage gpG-like protein
VNITGKVERGDELIASTNLYSSRMMARLRVVVERLAIEMTASVKNDTGRLRRSITYKLSNGDNTASATVGTNLSYGRAQEYGFVGEQSVKAFTRKTKDGKTVEVRAFSRHMNLPEHSYLRSTLAEHKAEYAARMTAAVTSKASA